MIGIYSNTGFMSSSVDGVILGMKTILEDPLRMAKLDFKDCFWQVPLAE